MTKHAMQHALEERGLAVSSTAEGILLRIIGPPDWILITPRDVDLLTQYMQSLLEEYEKHE